MRALVQIKRAAAIVNAELGERESDRARSIVTAANEVLAEAQPDELPLAMRRNGSGTQTYMNVNEVLANGASKCSAAELDAWIRPYDMIANTAPRESRR